MLILKKSGINVISDFFNYKNTLNLKKYKYNTDLICGANVISHIPNLIDLIKGIDTLLSKKGVFVFEEPYLGSMLKKISYFYSYLFSFISDKSYRTISNK